MISKGVSAAIDFQYGCWVESNICSVSRFEVTSFRLQKWLFFV